MVEKGFIHKNMYFVNKETDIIHAYFRRDKFTDIDSAPDDRCSLGGDVFMKEYDLTLAQLQTIDFAQVEKKGGIELNDCYFAPPLFEHFGRIWYPLYKGYRLLESEGQQQLYDDYLNSDRFEAMAFESLLLLRWASDKKIDLFMEHEKDKYGILALMNEKFYITGDDNEDIANCYHFHGILEFERS